MNVWAVAVLKRCLSNYKDWTAPWRSEGEIAQGFVLRAEADQQQGALEPISERGAEWLTEFDCALDERAFGS
jgi:hypothetical protein